MDRLDDLCEGLPQEEQEEEIELGDCMRGKSIMTIDTSNPNFKTESGKILDSDTIPNSRKDAPKGVYER